jgi:hypothetical protein
MQRTALVFPVLAGKTEAEIRRIADRFTADPEGYFESRRRAGITLERAYWQNTPMGDFVIGYAESDRSAVDVVGTWAEQATEIDRFFVATVKEVHGIDLTDVPQGPPPQTVGEWVDAAVTERRRGMAFCAPLAPGQEDRGRAWAKETFGSEAMTTSRRAMNQNVEVVTLTETPQGPVCGVYLEGVDPFAANRTLAASTEPFDVAFKNELSVLFPPFVDFSQPVPGVTEIFDSLSLPTASEGLRR